MFILFIELLWIKLFYYRLFLSFFKQRFIGMFSSHGLWLCLWNWKTQITCLKFRCNHLHSQHVLFLVCLYSWRVDWWNNSGSIPNLIILAQLKIMGTWKVEQLVSRGSSPRHAASPLWLVRSCATVQPYKLSSLKELAVSPAPVSVGRKSTELREGKASPVSARLSLSVI